MRAVLAASSTAVAVLAFTTVARGDDRTEIESILSEHVVSTASTAAQTASAAPALSTTITAEEMRALGIRSLAEAIDFLSLGAVTSDPLQTPDIGSRGVLFPHDDGKHFLLLVNGHAINDPLYGAARFDQGASVPIDIIDRVEVVLGPGSVLYGSNAMMGVINVITKTAAEYKGGHVLADVEPGRSYRASAGAGMVFPLFGVPSELTAGIEYYGRNGPSLAFPRLDLALAGKSGPYQQVEWGQGLPANIWGGSVKSAYFAEAPSALARLRVGDVEVNAMAGLYRRGIPYASSVENVQFDDSQSFATDRSLRLDLKHQATLSTLAQLTSRVYGDSYDHEQRLDENGAVGCLRGEVAVCEFHDIGVARWAGIEERLALNWLSDETLVTTLGTDARVLGVEAKQDMLDASTGLPLAPTAGRITTTWGLVSPYGQQTYSPAPWLDLNAGARLDVDTRYTPVLSPRAAAAIRPLERTTVKVIYSQAFRAPSVSETSTVDYLFAPSPNLRPETVRSAEVSLEQRFGTQRVLFGVFRTWWNDLVESTPVSAAELTALQTAGEEPLIVGNLVTYENVSSIDNYGYNAGWAGTLADRRLRYAANVTGAFTRLTQKQQSFYPAVSPQVFGNAHLAYAPGRGLPTVALGLFGVGPRAPDRTAPAGAVLPAAPAVADVRLAVSGRAPGLRAIGYFATADYTTAAYGPYTAGPTVPSFETVMSGSLARLPSPDFVPIDQFRVVFGLRLDFMTGARSDSGGEVE